VRSNWCWWKHAHMSNTSISLNLTSADLISWSFSTNVLSIMLGTYKHLTKYWKQHTTGCVRMSNCSMFWIEQL
jgi:hypothetical protein